MKIKKRKYIIIIILHYSIVIKKYIIYILISLNYFFEIINFSYDHSTYRIFYIYRNENKIIHTRDQRKISLTNKENR